MTTRTAQATHEPDRMPSEDEEQAAERAGHELEESGEARDVAAHFEDMAKRGVEQKGEGRID